MNLAQKIKQEALRIGFDLVGVASAFPHSDFNFFNQWVNKGYQGGMEYLARGREKRGDPQKILPGAKSFICCGLNYFHGFSEGGISNYAWGDDYHGVILEKLGVLEKFILEKAPKARMKSYVDTGAILERSYAASAGLGWIGKNTCLINQKVGSFFFVGEILTDLELEYDRPVADHCGTCTRCLDACPTQALTPYELNATRCISYLTIEHRGEIAPELADKMGNHLVGCDICQDVCPWNKKIPLSEEPSFAPRPENIHPSLESLQNLAPVEFSTRFKSSPIKRVKWEGLKRNVEIAVKNPAR